MLSSSAAAAVSDLYLVRSAARDFSSKDVSFSIGCLPVTREGNLVGIISDSDFVAVAIHLMEQLELVEPEEDF